MSYLGLKGVSVVEIHSDLVGTLQSKVVTSALAARSLGASTFTGITDSSSNVSPDPVLTK